MPLMSTYYKNEVDALFSGKSSKLDFSRHAQRDWSRSKSQSFGIYAGKKDSTTAIIKSYVKDCDPKEGKSCKKIVTDFQSNRVK